MLQQPNSTRQHLKPNFVPKITPYRACVNSIRAKLFAFRREKVVVESLSLNEILAQCMPVIWYQIRFAKVFVVIFAVCIFHEEMINFYIIFVTITV